MTEVNVKTVNTHLWEVVSRADGGTSVLEYARTIFWMWHVECRVRLVYKGFEIHGINRSYKNRGFANSIAPAIRCARDLVVEYAIDSDDNLAYEVVASLVERPTFQTGDGEYSTVPAQARDQWTNEHIRPRTLSVQTIWSSATGVPAAVLDSDAPDPGKMTVDQLAGLIERGYTRRAGTVIQKYPRAIDNLDPQHRPNGPCTLVNEMGSIAAVVRTALTKLSSSRKTRHGSTHEFATVEAAREAADKMDIPRNRWHIEIKETP